MFIDSAPFPPCVCVAGTLFTVLSVFIHFSAYFQKYRLTLYILFSVWFLVDSCSDVSVFQLVFLCQHEWGVTEMGIA